MAATNGQKPIGNHGSSASWSSSTHHDFSSAIEGNGSNSSLGGLNETSLPNRPRSRSDNPSAFRQDFDSLPPCISHWSPDSSDSSGSSEPKKEITPQSQSRFFPSRGLTTLAESPEEYKSTAQHYSPTPRRHSGRDSFGFLTQPSARHVFESMPNELASSQAMSSDANHHKTDSTDLEDRSTPGGVALTSPFKNPDGYNFDSFTSFRRRGPQPTATYKPPHMRWHANTLPGLHLNTSANMDDPFGSDPFSAPPFARQQGQPQGGFSRAAHNSESSMANSQASTVSDSNPAVKRQIQGSPYQPSLSQFPTRVAECMLLLLQSNTVAPEKVNNQKWSLERALHDARTVDFTKMDGDERSFVAKVISAHIMAGYAERAGPLPPQDGDPIKHKTASELKEAKKRRPAMPEPEPQVQIPTLIHFPPGPCLATAYLRSMPNPGYSALQGYLPFHDRSKLMRPVARGVVRISDIPYNATRPEVIAFFGRNAKLVSQPPGSPYYALHIILERATAKSMDCYVEFQTHADAVAAASRFTNPNRPNIRRPRVGDRAVKVAVVQQEELMQQLFPRAKCVQWNGQHPVVMTPQDQFTATFKGFVDSEEMHMLTKYAQNPSRSQSRFGAKHPQRVYENMISTLYKYPWFATELYTIEERDRLFNTTRYLLSCLCEAIVNGWHSQYLKPELLQELLIAGLTAPGFSERQLAELCDTVNGMIQIPRYVSPVAKYIPFDALRRTENGSPELVEYYEYILKVAASQVNYSPMPPQEAAAVEANFPYPFGNVYINWPEGEERKKYASMASVVKLEMETVEWYLRIMANGAP